MVEEVALFGESRTEDVEKDRLIWTGEDGKKTTGVLRPLESIRKVAFFPLQTRCFILSDSRACSTNRPQLKDPNQPLHL